MFVPVDAKISGVDFANMVTETPEMNYFIYEHMYSGAGVGIGDLNNDDLPDLFMVGNMVPDRLYLNKGGLRFEDASAKALPAEGDHGWHVGVTMADVNADGWLDIYVTRAGGFREGPRRTNLLFINQGADEQGVPHFKEEAAAAGIADSTRSVQSAFFDYDHDGDLDLYVANTAKEPGKKWSYEEMQQMVADRTSPTCRLYRNDGPGKGPHDAPLFTDVTDAAGMRNMVFGLGLAVSDLNKDGWVDIYQSNDFDEPDYMYMNKRDGSFVEQCQLRMRHISWFGMGCDIADYNNDGLPDVVVLDMASPDHVRSEKNMGSMSSDKFWTFVKVGLGYQYMFNTLQLNNGNGTFSEVGQLAGISKTDWSWSALFADLDNDGWKDLAVTNGYKRDVLDNDFTAKAKARQNEGRKFDLNEMFQLIPTSRIHSFLFHNDGLDSSSGSASLAFSDVTDDWGLTAKTISHGAAYADLDRDGDLDLVINHQDTIGSVYENKAVQSGRGNFLRVKVEGANTALGMGAEVTIHTGDGDPVSGDDRHSGLPLMHGERGAFRSWDPHASGSCDGEVARWSYRASSPTYPRVLCSWWNGRAPKGSRHHPPRSHFLQRSPPPAGLISHMRSAPTTMSILKCSSLTRNRRTVRCSAWGMPTAMVWRTCS